ncbi:MAG: hypothetical protein WC879_08100 [Melioribacteraceae bacterium]
MNFVEIEKRRYELASFLPQINGLPKALVLFSFYEKLLLTKDVNLIDAFSPEFIEEYLSELDSYSPFYSEPEKTQGIIDQLQFLKTTRMLVGYSQRINVIIRSLSNKLSNLYSILNGANDFTTFKGELLFPLIGKLITSADSISYSSIEKLKIRIIPSKEKDSFIFIPSDLKDEELEEQSKICFKLAFNYLSAYKTKFHKFHEVLIYFDNLHAKYNGKSLGIVLTIGIIERLSYVYNLPYITYVKSNIASTGEIDKNGSLISIGENNIVRKVESVFYSNIDTIVIPKADEIPATSKLKELNEKFPERVLNIIPVVNLTDLLTRRNLVDIKKQSAVIRTAKNIKKNWVAVSLSFIILLIIGFIWIREFDDNPAQLFNDGNKLFVKNKSGKILWSRFRWRVPVLWQINDSYFRTDEKIVDIDLDGINEMLLCHEPQETLNSQNEYGRIVCLNKEGKEIWKYIFTDTVSSQREFLTPPYEIFLIDTISSKGQRQLVAIARNKTSFSSALFRLDLKTGKRLDGTSWNSGHIVEGIIEDVDQDNLKEIIFIAYNNGFEKISTVIIRLDDLINTKVVPTTQDYLINKFPISELKAMVLFPNTDFSKYLELRMALIHQGNLDFRIADKTLTQRIFQNENERDASIYFTFNSSLKEFDMFMDSKFRVLRDTLVAHGKLQPPYSDTPEYKELLTSQIQVWDGEKFILLDEWKKKRAAK